jgi:hypothetical protein
MESRTMQAESGAGAAGIFPAMFVEPVATRWVLPRNHYDAGLQMSIETAFQLQTPSTGTVTGSSSRSDSDSQMGINRGTDDHSSDSDTD